MNYQFGVRETDKHDGELAEIEAENLEEAKRKFAEMFPEDVHNVEVITSDNGYEEFSRLEYFCPKCGEKLSYKTPVSDGYFMACKKCDEDFYQFELKSL